MASYASAPSLARRADQAGILVAGMNVPLTFQRTLMPRPTMDQAIVTGLSIAANHALVSLVQETIQSGALLVLGGGKQKTRSFDDRTWSQVTIALDLAAVGVGLAVQRAMRQCHRGARSPLHARGVCPVRGTAGRR